MADSRVKTVSSSSVLPSSKELYSIVMSQEEPFVLIEAISDWKCADWNPEFLARELSGLQTRFRFARRDFDDSSFQLMETDCEFKNGTLNNFCCWLRGEQECAGELARFDRADYWCYAGYKYIAELFKDLPHLRYAVDWSKFGFPGRSGDESTIWIGSEGASTPCHFDTYGCNLVAQIYGRKRWTLFPPSDTDKLYPTRVPYEESSVFSSVNVVNPDRNLFPDFKDAVQYQVVLQPGDVLFVPKHWWHYVESLETSISINTWIELESDHVDRVHEAVTRTLVCALKRADHSDDHTWVNPSEEMGTHEENMGYLQQSLQSLYNIVDPTDTTGQCPEHKSLFVGLISTNDFINCISSPQVMKLITEQLLRKLGANLETSKASDKDETRSTSGTMATDACATQASGVVESASCSCARDEQVCKHKSIIEGDVRLAQERNDSEASRDPDHYHLEQKRQRLQDEAK